MNLTGNSAFSATRELIDHFGRSVHSWAKKAAARKEGRSRPHPQHTVLPSQFRQFFPFFGGQPRRTTLVDLGLGHPPSQTRTGYSQPAGHNRQRLVALPYQINGSSPELLRKKQQAQYLLPERPNSLSHDHRIRVRQNGGIPTTLLCSSRSSMAAAMVLSEKISPQEATRRFVVRMIDPFRTVGR